MERANGAMMVFSPRFRLSVWLVGPVVVALIPVSATAGSFITGLLNRITAGLLEQVFQKPHMGEDLL